MSISAAAAYATGEGGVQCQVVGQDLGLVAPVRIAGSGVDSPWFHQWTGRVRSGSGGGVGPSAAF